MSDIPVIGPNEPCPDYPHHHRIDLTDEPMFYLGELNILHSSKHPPCDDPACESDHGAGLCLDVQLLTEDDVDNPLRIFIQLPVSAGLAMIRELSESINLALVESEESEE